ncbi:MAG: hypothetical protein L0210_02530 [Rhodospirillales bacterium]|nr:hypothetical protein [Rhodospirillales bacterium]
MTGSPILVGRSAVLALCCLLGINGEISAQDDPDAKRATISRLISTVEYGVPDSPAFELLPDRPSEVAHAVTPKDFKSALSTWRDGQKLRIGAALDTRPLVRSGGSLAEYQTSWFRQAAFRTVLAAGTAAAVEGSTDVVIAGGLRIPLVDRGDPRADPTFNQQLAEAYAKGLEDQGPPPFDATKEQLAERAAIASKAIEPLREAYRRNHWNALKVDLGAAGSVQASKGLISRDSIQADRVGIWGAVALPIVRMGQLTISGKASWLHTDSLVDESSRQSFGARLRVFPSERLSFSGEVARIWSDHNRDPAQDDRWNHLAVVVEWYVPELEGWVGVGYGGDADRRSDNKNQLSLTYTIYRQRLLEAP